MEALRANKQTPLTANDQALKAFALFALGHRAYI
jgi:hypothetical protein